MTTHQDAIVRLEVQSANGEDARLQVVVGSGQLLKLPYIFTYFTTSTTAGVRSRGDRVSKGQEIGRLALDGILVHPGSST